MTIKDGWYSLKSSPTAKDICNVCGERVDRLETGEIRVKLEHNTGVMHRLVAEIVLRRPLSIAHDAKHVNGGNALPKKHDETMTLFDATQWMRQRRYPAHTKGTLRGMRKRGCASAG